MSTKRTVAFLGPLGTFSHQACIQMFGDDVELAPQATITKTYEALSSTVQDALLPSENSTHGHVVDTYDLLRLPDVGTRVRIRGDTVLRIEHCLIAPEGVAFEDIRVVISHEQALGQCLSFLNKHLPAAKRIKCSSTAEAACMIRKDAPGAGRAAICSRAVIALYPDLSILRSGIQDQGDNFTRFLRLSLGTTALDAVSKISSVGRAIFRLQPPSGNIGILAILSALELEILKMDRRPSLSTEPFHDTYFVEVEAPADMDATAVIARVRNVGAEATLLGQW